LKYTRDPHDGHARISLIRLPDRHEISAEKKGECFRRLMFFGLRPEDGEGTRSELVGTRYDTKRGKTEALSLAVALPIHAGLADNLYKSGGKTSSVM
jgi:hypothetical protein